MGAPDAASAAPAPVREAGGAIVQHETKLTETVLTGGGIISRKLVVVTPENLTIAPGQREKNSSNKKPRLQDQGSSRSRMLRSHHKLGVPCRQLFPPLPRTKAGRVELESGGPAALRPAGVRPGASSFAAGDAAGPPGGRCQHCRHRRRTERPAGGVSELLPARTRASTPSRRPTTVTAPTAAPNFWA